MAVNWQEWRSRIERIEEVSEGEKTRAKGALSYLESILGDKLDVGHPRFERIIHNSAPWTLKWLIELAASINLISSKKGGHLIIEKLKQRGTFSESLFQIYIATVLLQGNFEVEFIKETNDKKVPDLQITHNKSKKNLCLELTEIQKPSQERKNEETYWPIVECLNQGSMINYETKLHYRGIVHRYLSKPARNNVISKIQEAIKDAYENGHSYLIIPGKLNMAIADDSNYSILETWAKRKGMIEDNATESKFSSLRTPDPQPDKSFIIANKINKKRMQFDKRLPNGLIIKFNNLFPKRDIKKVKSLIQDLEQYVYDCEDLDLLIIIDNDLGGFYRDMIYSKKNILYLIQNIFPIQKQILIIFNNHSAKKEDTKIFSNDIMKAFQLSNIILF